MSNLSTSSPTTRPSTPDRLTLLAPLSGHLVPIETVPDQVFAEKMVGDGISIDPVSQSLLAPCAGEVIQLHPSHHAVTLKSPEGIEVLMHIGLDTVMLRGQGFTPHVKLGDRVKAGDALIDFDADYIALNARSLLTQIVIANGERVASLLPRSGEVAGGQDVVLELALRGASQQAIAAPSPAVTSDPIAIPNPTGLHARPAAVLAALAKQYQSTIQLRKGDQAANARSVVSLMGLEIGSGDTVQLVAEGADAPAAVAELSAALRSGLGEEGAQPVSAAAASTGALAATPPKPPRSADPDLILGVGAAAGVAVGSTYRIRHQEIAVDEAAQSADEEQRRLEAAIAQAKQEIEALRIKVEGQADGGKAAIFAAHQELLSDPALLDAAADAIAQGKSAAFAWQQTYLSQANQLSQLKNELLAARAGDLRDVGERVLRILTGVTEAATYPDRAILIAEDLTPSDTATMDRAAGFCTVGGGTTSHVSILARSMDLPAIVGTEARVLDLPDGTPVILDGSKGTLRLNPSAAEIEQIQQRQARLKARQEQALAAAMQPATTTDGQRIEVVANIGGVADAEKAVALGAEGVGLLRSEFVFLDRPTAPSEAEQTEIYSRVAEILGAERTLIIRTLDVGGDKPLPYLPMPPEENPFLGERGIRIGFDRPELLRTQLRAILRASQLGNVQVMFPMIATLAEFRRAKAMLEEERQTLGMAAIPVGIMVEIPAAAVMADPFAREADFFSVGTNDLTQYTLAIDRGHPKLAAQVDGLDPAVLTLIGSAARAANQQGKWCGICGGIGSDPQAIPLLIGLGVRELSVSVPSIPMVKAQIRELSLAECQRLAAQALGAATAKEVRELCPIGED